jgi:hypothetical protein
MRLGLTIRPVDYVRRPEGRRVSRDFVGCVLADNVDQQERATGNWCRQACDLQKWRTIAGVDVYDTTVMLYLEADTPDQLRAAEVVHPCKARKRLHANSGSPAVLRIVKLLCGQRPRTSASRRVPCCLVSNCRCRRPRVFLDHLPILGSKQHRFRHSGAETVNCPQTGLCCSLLTAFDDATSRTIHHFRSPVAR